MEAIIGGIRDLISRIFGGSGPPPPGPAADPLVEIASLVVRQEREREVMLESLASSGNTCVSLGLIFQYLEGETDVRKAAEVLRAITSPAVVNVFKHPGGMPACLGLTRMLATACRYCTLYCDPEVSRSCGKEELKEVCMTAVVLCDYLLWPLAERKRDQALPKEQLAMVTQAVGTFAKILEKMQSEWSDKITGILPLFAERVTQIVAEPDLSNEGLRRALLDFAHQIPGAIEAASRHDVSEWRKMLHAMCQGPDRDGLTFSSRLWRYLVRLEESEAHEYARDMTSAMLCFLRRQQNETGPPDIPYSEAEIVAGGANAFIEQCCATGAGAPEEWGSYIRPPLSGLAEKHLDDLVDDWRPVHEYLCKMLASIDLLSDDERVFRPYDRARVNVDATITGDARGEDYPGSITNVSRTGCLFRFHAVTQLDIDASSFPRNSLVLEFDVDDQHFAVKIAYAVEHKHRKSDPGELVLGLKFSDPLPQNVFDLLFQRSDGIRV